MRRLLLAIKVLFADRAFIAIQVGDMHHSDYVNADIRLTQFIYQVSNDVLKYDAEISMDEAVREANNIINCKK